MTTPSVGQPLPRLDGPDKVTGRAPYAVEHAPPGHAPPLHAWLVQSTVAKGRVLRIDASAALHHPGVRRVLDHTSAPRLSDTDDAELAILQDERIAFRGQIVAVVLAETPEAAREGAALLEVHQEAVPHEVMLTLDTEIHDPQDVDQDVDGDETASGGSDFAAALADSALVVDRVYRTPHEHNNPLEPHAVLAAWDGARLTLHDSTQGVHSVASTLAPMLGLEQDQVRVVAPYVGGGFGSKGVPHSPEMAAALAAIAVAGRPVKLAVTRQQMFALTGYRSQTVSRVRLGARPDGRLTAFGHDAVSQTATIKEYTERAATSTGMMYAAPQRSNSQQVARLDVAVPSWMRAPGRMTGMFALEVAMDELAVACDIDPIDLRERNEPAVDPDTGNPWNDRRLVECLRRGAERFGWAHRPRAARATEDGDWWVGTGVAAATYPMVWNAGNAARVVALGNGRYEVSIGAVDIGTGARTALAQIAADALGVAMEDLDLAIGDTELPKATVAGDSAGTGSWGTAIVQAVERFRADHGPAPDPGAETTFTTESYPDPESHSLHSFGAVFAEARVHRWTGELRVPRLYGLYSVGKVINPATARSQLRGGLVMGLSAALFEESYRDPRFGHIVTQDLASYHFAAHADAMDVDADWLDEDDRLSTPMGSRGVGEIGIVGTPAAVVNAVHHATGIRVRSLPATADAFLD
jgi:xanthine dehydrogenase YagR molybdenum-binding subunit